MKAVYWVLPGLLAGRPGPSEVAWDLDHLWSEGFRTMVSLARTDGAQIQVVGFRHYYAPLNGGLAGLPLLRRRLVRQMLPVVDFVAEELHAGRPTLVHCRQGKDRTGAVLAAHLIRHHGLLPDEALRRVREANPRAMTSVGFDRLPGLFADMLARTS